MLVSHIGPFHEDPTFRVTPPSREEVTPEKYEFIGRCVPIVCTDLVFIDDEFASLVANDEVRRAMLTFLEDGKISAGLRKDLQPATTGTAPRQPAML